jgi:Helix-turn-helix domain
LVTAAGDRGTRRLGRRHQEPETTPQEPETTPAEAGATLRAARERMGVTLAEVQDRTGVPWPQLEALEAGDLSRFPDRRSVLVALHRCADLLQLDAGELARTVEAHWSPLVGAMASVSSATGVVPRAGSGPTRSTGHLSRYPGDASHLRAFTQTAQVPNVGGSGGARPNGHGGAAFAHTGVFGSVPRRRGYVRPAPLALRVAVWATAALVAVGLAGLAVNHWHRQWLADIHVIRTTTHGSGSGGAQFGSLPSVPSSSPTGPATVSQADTGPVSSTVTVRASNFRVVVAALQRCWVYVITPQAATPIYQGVLQGGQVQTFDSANGQLSIQLGASQVALAVKVHDKLVPGWLFKPQSAPYTLNFASG